MKDDFGKFVTSRIVPATAPIVAWRAWKVSETTVSAPKRWYRRAVSRPEEPRLLSTLVRGSHSTTWEPYKPLIARCCANEISGKSPCVTVLREDCACGIWACKSLVNLMQHGCAGVYPVAVIGRVRLWGYVHEYEGGFRGAAASVVDLWLGNDAAGDIARRLGSAYGVPVSVDVPAEILLSGSVGVLTPDDAELEMA